MKAVVLVGGEGTRLRPLTETIPKPLLPLMDRVSLDLVLDHLAAHGIGEAVLSSPYLETTFRPFIERRSGPPAISWITETEPLGTGGAIVNAIELAGVDGTFVALNGDILTDLDLTAMIAFHRQRAAAITIALHHVEDARAFGLVPTDPDGRVRGFLEKPATAVPGEVNAGTYVLEASALLGWTRGAAISIEREVFPSVIGSGARVFGYTSGAYWLDLGTPETYLQAHADLFAGRVHGVSYPSPWIAADADVDPGAHLGPSVAVGAGARVGPHARLEDSVVHPRAIVEEGARLLRSIVGTGAQVGREAALSDAVIGEGATVAAGQRLEGARVPAFRVARTPH